MKIILEDLADVSYEYPATVYFIADTPELNSIIDTLRKRNGYPTFFDEDDPNMWGDGWYNFYAEVDLENMRCTAFWGVVVANNRDIKDDGRKYYINVDYEDISRQIAEQDDLKIAKEYALRED